MVLRYLTHINSFPGGDWDVPYDLLQKSENPMVVSENPMPVLSGDALRFITSWTLGDSIRIPLAHNIMRCAWCGPYDLGGPFSVMSSMMNHVILYSISWSWEAWGSKEHKDINFHIMLAIRRPTKHTWMHTFIHTGKLTYMDLYNSHGFMKGALLTNK
jgi:hypothetical protein